MNIWIYEKFELAHVFLISYFSYVSLHAFRKLFVHSLVEISSGIFYNLPDAQLHQLAAKSLRLSPLGSFFSVLLSRTSQLLRLTLGAKMMFGWWRAPYNSEALCRWRNDRFLVLLMPRRTELLLVFVEIALRQENNRILPLTCVLLPKKSDTNCANLYFSIQ